MGQLLHRCMTKATTAEGDDVRRSLNWVLSRRCTLKVFDDRLECGDWVVPYRDVDEAVLFRVRQMLIPGYVLRVKAQGRIYQFGLNRGKYWDGELPFPVAREAASVGYSWFSIAVRVVLVGCVAYLVWSGCVERQAAPMR